MQQRRIAPDFQALHRTERKFAAFELGTGRDLRVSNSFSVSMKSQNHVTWATGLYSKLTGRLARRVYLGLLLLPVIFTAGVRIRSVLLTRKIHAVLSGLEQVRVDQTTEEQLLKTVPYLVRHGNLRPELAGVEWYYRADISNGVERRWLFRLAETHLFQFLWPWPLIMDRQTEHTQVLSFPLKIAYRLGWRYVGFSALVKVRNGRASSVWYGIEPDVEQGYPRFYSVSAVSFHGLWMEHALPPLVSSADDENPEYKVSTTRTQYDAERGLRAEYAADAPRELIAHAFQVDLSCYWGIRGCVSAREIAPLFWRDKQAIEAKAVSRLRGPGNPCPDTVLAARVRYLLDLNVELLEVTDSGRERANGKREAGESPTISYQLKEVIRGHSGRAQTLVPYRTSIASPLGSTERMSNPLPPSLKARDRVLAFTGANFDSCQIVPATPSAESAVRSAVPAPRWPEDARPMGPTG
jgi:hypothetical protein